MSIYFNERDFNTTNYDDLKVIKLVSNRHHINNNFTIIPEEGGLINDLTIEENILLGHHHKNLEDLFSIKFSTKTKNLNIIRNTFRFKNTIYQHWWYQLNGILICNRFFKVTNLLFIYFRGNKGHQFNSNCEHETNFCKKNFLL